MKKNKKSLKKLTLNKKVVSNLEENQVSGGTIATLVNCPQTIFCPRTIACPNTFICPQTAICPQTLRCPIKTLDCSFAGCPSGIVC